MSHWELERLPVVLMQMVIDVREIERGVVMLRVKKDVMRKGIAGSRKLVNSSGKLIAKSEGPRIDAKIGAMAAARAFVTLEAGKEVPTMIALIR
jgi:hypothetical protein